MILIHTHPRSQSSQASWSASDCWESLSGTGIFSGTRTRSTIAKQIVLFTDIAAISYMVTYQAKMFW